jgi:hypothetical protein
MNEIPEISWRESFDVYLAQCEAWFDKFHDDWEWIEERKTFLPQGMSVQLTLEKAFVDFWGTEVGWHWCKKHRRGKKMDWAATIRNAIDARQNRVYFGRGKPDYESEKIDRIKTGEKHASASKQE